MIAATSGSVVAKLRRRAVRTAGHRRLHVHPEALASRGRQDPRALHRPVVARHPAAAGRQGAVRRAALRRDGGVGARGVRRGVHAAGDAHDQVRRHGRPREGLRGDRQGREHRRAVDPRVVQGAAEGDAVTRTRRARALGGGRAGRGREEDDELLRAAEELGIDLSPGSLRAAARQPTAEEAEEGQERVDKDGELALPADEMLDDLADVELAIGESPKEEVEDEVGPVADVDLADIEVED